MEKFWALRISERFVNEVGRLNFEPLSDYLRRKGDKEYDENSVTDCDYLQSEAKIKTNKKI